MKQPKGEARRWLKQAIHDLKVARENFKSSFYSDACFEAEQATQKALKAYLFFQGERFVWIHSIFELLLKTCSWDKKFKIFLDQGKVLDQYYIPTRYPDALAPPAVPYEVYTKENAKEAILIAQKILKAIKEKITP